MIMRVPGAGKKRNRKINTLNQLWAFLKCTPLKKLLNHSFMFAQYWYA
jgi:hypothetical protein